MDCTPQQIEQFQKSATHINLECNLLMQKLNTIIRDIIISKNNLVVDCRGGTINRLNIVSPLVNGAYQPVNGVTVRNCIVKSGIRISGHSINGEGAVNVSDSHTNPNHTAYSQSVAPNNILLDHISFTPNGSIPLYLSPGVHDVTVQNSTFSGTSGSVVIYMDAESGFNKILNNAIGTKTSRRELIAIDGSANNLIKGNTFTTLGNGGIFLYRNCGEGGAVRFQTPSYNTIEGNTFKYVNCKWFTCKPGIWLSARNRGFISWTGFTKFCDADKGYWPKLNTSSTTDQDLATENSIVGNDMPEEMITDTEPSGTNHFIYYK